MNQDYINTSLPGLLNKVIQTLDLPEEGFKEKLNSLSPTENMIRLAILFKFSEGNKVNVADLTPIVKQLDVDIQSILEKFSELDLIHWDTSSGNVTVAYPFSGNSTPHMVTLSEKSPAFSMCAIDALGIPSMFESDALIESECAYCCKKINIDIKNNIPVSNPETVVVGIGTVADINTCCDFSSETDSKSFLSTSCCPTIQFYCSKEHWYQSNEKDLTKTGDMLTLIEAFTVANELFGGMMKSKPMSDCCGTSNQEKSVKSINENDCCNVQPSTQETATDCQKITSVTTCPMCGGKGKEVKILTLKSILVPNALEILDVHQTYRFCASENCDIVYFGHQGAQFTTNDVRISVFQKDQGQDINVCYCFGWTRSKITNEIYTTGKSTAVPSISAHMKAERCGCDVNNPQGSCCLGNVMATVKEAKQQVNIPSE